MLLCRLNSKERLTDNHGFSDPSVWQVLFQDKQTEPVTSRKTIDDLSYPMIQFEISSEIRILKTRICL